MEGEANFVLVILRLEVLVYKHPFLAGRCRTQRRMPFSVRIPTTVVQIKVMSSAIRVLKSEKTTIIWLASILQEAKAEHPKNSHKLQEIVSLKGVNTQVKEARIVRQVKIRAIWIIRR